MKASRKVFTVLSIALPLLLVVSMTHAEDGGSTSSSTTNTTICSGIDQQREACLKQDMGYTKAFNNDKQCWEVKCMTRPSSICPNVDEMIRKCTAHNKTFTKSVDDHQCTKITCTETNSVCPTNIDEMGKKCGDRGFNTVIYNGCRIAKCNESSKTVTQPTTSSDSGTVMCKRTMVGNFYVFTCEDGKTMRVPNNEGQDKPKPPMAVGACSEIERRIREAKEGLAKDPTNEKLKALLSDSMNKWEECRKAQGLSIVRPPSSSSTGTSSGNECVTRKDGNCTIKLCNGKIVSRVCTLMTTPKGQ